MNPEEVRTARALAETLTRAKEEAGLSFNDIAELSGLSRAHITRVFYGTVDVRLGDLRRICEPLELRPDEVVRESLANATGKVTTGS